MAAVVVAEDIVVVAEDIVVVVENIEVVVVVVELAEIVEAAVVAATYWSFDIDLKKRILSCCLAIQDAKFQATLCGYLMVIAKNVVVVEVARALLAEYIVILGNRWWQAHRAGCRRKVSCLKRVFGASSCR